MIDLVRNRETLKERVEGVLKKRGKSGATASRDEVKAVTVKVVEEDGPLAVKEVVAKVVAVVKESGKCAEGVAALAQGKSDEERGKSPHTAPVALSNPA